MNMRKTRRAPAGTNVLIHGRLNVVFGAITITTPIVFEGKDWRSGCGLEGQLGFLEWQPAIFLKLSTESTCEQSAFEVGPYQGFPNLEQASSLHASDTVTGQAIASVPRSPIDWWMIMALVAFEATLFA